MEKRAPPAVSYFLPSFFSECVKYVSNLIGVQTGRTFLAFCVSCFVYNVNVDLLAEVSAFHLGLILSFYSAAAIAVAIDRVCFSFYEASRFWKSSQVNHTLGSCVRACLLNSPQHAQPHTCVINIRKLGRSSSRKLFLTS